MLDDTSKVFPGVYIGGGRAAKDLAHLSRLGVTHVLNAAENDVHLNPSKLRKAGLAYMGFRCEDHPSADIRQVDMYQ